MSHPVATREQSHPPVRRATRIREGRWLGGVCTGVARHLGVSVVWVRVAFLALAACNLVGAVAYALLWLLLPPAPVAAASPGTASNTRAGMRVPTRSSKAVDVGIGASVIALGVGLIWLMQSLGAGVSGALVWPVGFACVGLALVWRQADDTVAPEATVPRRWYSPLLARRGIYAAARVVIGLTLVGASIGLIVAGQIGWSKLPLALAMFALALGGAALVAAPWVFRARQQLTAAREEKLLADQRADMAAHLHDSVLQTLALIQRQADDPRTVSSLARRQERELRQWLYGQAPDDATIKAALTRAAAEVEDEGGVPVELVVVGDGPIDDDTRAVVAAAREAMMNAAKHSGAPLIDVYAEVAEGLEVFVRDRGRGFDLATIDGDRQGIRRSIRERMERHGGTASVRSAPGEGTEVRLEMRR